MDAGDLVLRMAGNGLFRFPHRRFKGSTHAYEAALGCQLVKYRLLHEVLRSLSLVLVKYCLPHEALCGYSFEEVSCALL